MSVKVQKDVKVGDTVRSFDFEGRYDCYVEGTLEEIGDCLRYGYDQYKIKVARRVVGNEETDAHPDYVFPPKNGTPKADSSGVYNGVLLAQS